MDAPEDPAGKQKKKKSARGKSPPNMASPAPDQTAKHASEPASLQPDGPAAPPPDAAPLQLPGPCRLSAPEFIVLLPGLIKLGRRILASKSIPHFDAEDILQEAMIRFGKSFDPSRKVKPETYLDRLLRWETGNYRQKQAKQSKIVRLLSLENETTETYKQPIRCKI